MAHIEKRTSRKKPYRVRYRGPDGKERSRSFLRRVDAEKFASTTETDKARGAWVDPRLTQTKYEDWAARWMRTVADLKPKTLIGYESLLRNHVLPEFGSLGLGAVEPLQVREWVAGMRKNGLSPSRTRQAYQVFSASMKAAVESGYVMRTPCIGVKIQRGQRREMLFLSAEQVEALAAAMPEPYDTLVYVLAYGGIRWGEAAALRRKRCDLLRGRLDIAQSLAEVKGGLYFGDTKTYQRRSVTLPRFLRDKIDAHLEARVDPDPDALVFTAPEGGPLRNTNFRRAMWLRAVEAARLPSVRIHDMRHTCAALLIRQGEHPKKVQAHLGHSSIQVTFDLYGHLFDDDMDRLAEGLDSAYRAAQTRPKDEPRFVNRATNAV